VKKLDPDIIALKMVVKAMKICPEDMRKATLQYAWDRFVVRPAKSPSKTGQVEGA
jgi:hypothetical protein